MNKPKIAVLIDWYLPGTKAGGPVRSVYSLVSLLKNHFDFYIITTNVDLGKTEPYPDTQPNQLISRDGVNYFYFSHANLNTETVKNLLNKINPKLVYLNSFWSVNFSINIVRLKKQKQIDFPILLAPRGMLGKGALGLKPIKKKLYLLIANIFGLYKNIPFHATQTQEKNDIQNRIYSAKVSIAPNVNSGSISENTSKKITNTLSMFYLSRVAKVKNLHFALEVLKEIPLEYSIVYDIYGNKEDAEYWAYCEEIIKTLPSNVQVTYKRELEFNEVQSVIGKYNLLFLPTLNENFGHSIVESLLCGCPVIISDQTPWNDVEVNGAGYAISLDDKQKFVEAIKKSATLNEQEFSITSKKAINYISNKIDLEAITNQYKTLFNE